MNDSPKTPSHPEEVGPHEKPLTLDDIHPETPNPPISTLAKTEEKHAEVESRGLRIAGDLLEQKRRLIDIVVSVIGFVILGLYLTFMITLWCLFASQKPFTGELPVTGVVLLGLTGSIPTILSISLLVGLFANKDGSKEKEEKGLVDLNTLLKLASEGAKHVK